MEPFKIITELSKLRDFELDEDLPRVSPEDLTEDYEGIRERKASPASVIYPYYGKDFLKEISSAEEANRALYDKNKFKSRLKEGHSVGLQQDAYTRIFEEIPVSIGAANKADKSRPRKSGTYTYETLTEDEIPKVETYSRRTSLKDPLAINKLPKHRAKLWGDDYMARNSYNPEYPVPTAEDTYEHEMTHHVLRPAFQRQRDFLGFHANYYGDSDMAELAQIPLKTTRDGSPLKRPIKIGDIHESKPAEIMGSLGRLQRETFKEKKSRMEPGEFSDLVYSKKNPAHLSQEGMRSVTYARNVIHAIEENYKPLKDESESFKKSKKSKAENLKKKFLERLEELLPTLVENEGTPSQVRRI